MFNNLIHQQSIVHIFWNLKLVRYLFLSLFEVNYISTAKLNLPLSPLSQTKSQMWCMLTLVVWTFRSRKLEKLWSCHSHTLNFTNRFDIKEKLDNLHGHWQMCFLNLKLITVRENDIISFLKDFKNHGAEYQITLIYCVEYWITLILFPSIRLALIHLEVFLCTDHQVVVKLCWLRPWHTTPQVGPSY